MNLNILSYVQQKSMILMCGGGGGAIPLLWQMGPLHVDNCQLIPKKRADLPLLTFHYLFVHSTILLKFSKLNLNIKKHSYYIQLEMYCSKKVLIQLIILWEKRRFLFKVYKYLLCIGGPSNKQAGSVGVAAENLNFFGNWVLFYAFWLCLRALLQWNPSTN